MSGTITQEGANVVSSQMLLQLNAETQLFKQIACGYSHALMIDTEDQIYSFGGNLYGQLGVGVDTDKGVNPVGISDINEGGDKVLMISCGAGFSLCYTELGILYYWGMLIPDDIASIQWIPSFMSMSMPKDIT